MRALVALCACVFLGAAHDASAQATRVEQLRFPPLPKFDVPPPTRIVLDNGMVVIMVEDHELPVIDVSVLVRTGSRLEPAGKVGLASLTGTVLRTGGTRTMNGDALDEYLDRRAARISSGISETVGTVSMNCLTADFPDILKVFADVVRHPAFEESKLAIAKNQVTAGIARQNDDPDDIESREFDKLIYGKDSPYARIETYETLSSITRADLVAWHARDFHPNRIILGLSGDFRTADARALLTQLFGDWKRGPAADPVAPVQPQAAKGLYEVVKNDMTQSSIAMGHLGIVRNNPDYFAVQVLNQVLGGGMGSRLFSNVRSKKGLAYAVSGGIGANWDYPGTTDVSMKTKTETTAAGIEALLEEVRGLVSSPPTEVEVQKAKDAILNSFVFTSDALRKIVSQQVTYEYYGYPLDWLQRYRTAIDQVTLPQVRSAAVKYFHPDEFAILVVGPEKGRDKPLSTFGNVTKLDITIPEPAAAPKAPGSVDARQRGQALIVKALESMGGAPAVDAVRSVEQKGSATLTTPQGEVQVAISTWVVLPDRLRQEIKLPFGTISTVYTPADAFMETPQGVAPIPDSTRADLEKSFHRNPIGLLKARTDPGFVATATGTGTADGKAVDLVTVEVKGVTATLGIESTTGRILSLAFRAAGAGGAPADTVRTFSDFRPVNGLTLPFKTASTANGQPASTETLETMTINTAIDEALFKRK